MNSQITELSKTDPDPWVLYFVARKDLGMSSGKLAIQVGHGVQLFMEVVHEYQADRGLGGIAGLLADTASWRASGYRKVLLRANDRQWRRLNEELEPVIVVQDAGLTELSPGEETVMVFSPMKKSQAPKLLQRLQRYE